MKRAFHHPQSLFQDTAASLFACTMYPFSALQLIVIEWHSGRETEALSDSDGEGEGEDGDSSVQGGGTTEPAVRYSSQEDYDQYVMFPHLAHIVRLCHSHPHVSP